ncbi:hypothetical protein MHYP_G00310380 [Metynnis hypsauchen]
MGPEESSDLRDTMSDTPPPSPGPPGCSAGLSSGSPLPSPPISPAPAAVIFRSPATRHLTHLDPWRRHSWEPGAVVQGSPANDTRSVSLEDLDPEDMALVLGGTLGCRRVRDARRSVTQEGSLSSLTEEEAPTEQQQQLHSALEEQACQMHGCSASAPSLCVVRRTPKTSAPRPRSYCYESVPYYQGRGSTHSLDSELLGIGWEGGGQIRGERDEDKEESTGSSFGRTFSFLRKMTSKRKGSAVQPESNKA